jgi:ABC-2 type transport system permease protein
VIIRFADLLWIESRKAIRSRMPLWTALGSSFMPLGIAFLLFLARNPQISQNLGLLGAKANLLTYAEIDWPAYLGLSGQIVAIGGFFIFVLVISWVFGREFADGTLKDFLAVPVPRASILLGKFILVTVWCSGLAIFMFAVSLLMGAAMHLQGGTASVISQGSLKVFVSAGLSILVVLPFALLASLGRGYLLPLGSVILILMSTQLATILGWGEYFPWAIAGLFAQGNIPLSPVSYWIVIITALLGIAATILWWNHADQNR